MLTRRLRIFPILAFLRFFPFRFEKLFLKIVQLFSSISKIKVMNTLNLISFIYVVQSLNIIGISFYISLILNRVFNCQLNRTQALSS